MSAFLLTLTLAALGGDEPRTYHEINSDVHAAMKREAVAESDAARAAAIVDLCALYGELSTDPRLETFPQIKSCKVGLWSRLVRIKKSLEAEIKRQERQVPQDDAAADPQQPNLEAVAAGQALADQLSLVGSTLGGPAKVFSESSGAFGGGTVRDHGEALVDLIERTIDPEFWEVNGGPGRIYYFAPLMALVVTATDEIHRKIGGAGAALRGRP